MRKLLLALLFLPVFAAAQTNSACPGATGATPHCVIVTWQPPVTGTAPTGYNVYTGGTTAGQCAVVDAATCTKVGSVTNGILTLTQLSSVASPLAEGKTYYYVITSTNGTAESAPSTEVSATVPFLVPNPPVSPTTVAK